VLVGDEGVCTRYPFLDLEDESDHVAQSDEQVGSEVWHPEALVRFFIDGDPPSNLELAPLNEVPTLEVFPQVAETLA